MAKPWLTSVIMQYSVRLYKHNDCKTIFIDCDPAGTFLNAPRQIIAFWYYEKKNKVKWLYSVQKRNQMELDIKEESESNGC